MWEEKNKGGSEAERARTGMPYLESNEHVSPVLNFAWRSLSLFLTSSLHGTQFPFVFSFNFLVQLMS